MDQRFTINPIESGLLSSVEMAIFDVDHTLAFPKDPAFYEQYSLSVKLAIAQHFGLDDERAEHLASFYRENYNGAEHALFSGTVTEHFSDISKKSPNFDILYDTMVQIKTDELFHDKSDLSQSIASLRDAGVLTVALTSSPDLLAMRILAESGYDISSNFDGFHAYTRENGPPKKVDGPRVFSEIASEFNIGVDHVISVGDSLSQDILPARKIGMLTCWISGVLSPDYTGMQTEKTDTIVSALIEAKNTSPDNFDIV